jgi:hypothetical protein
MKKFLSLLPLVFLIACATPQTENPGQIVYQIQSGYAVALKTELAYSNLPDCSTGIKLCSKKDVIRQVQKADDLAWDAIQAAQTAVRTPGFGDSGVTTTIASARALTDAFIGITNTLKIK